MLKIYGTMLCKDCVDCRRELEEAGVAYAFLDFADHILYLKEFLAMRDSEAVFKVVKEKGSIGVPCIVEENGSVSLTWDQYVAQV